MDWTEKKAKQARARLKKWRVMTNRVPLGNVDSSLISAVENDLNSISAIKILEQLEKEERWSDLKASARVIGLLTPELSDWEWAPRTLEIAQRNKLRTLKSTKNRNLDYFVALERFNRLFGLHSRLIETAELAAPFIHSDIYRKFDSLDRELIAVLKGFNVSEHALFLAEEREWRRIAYRFPNIIKTAHKSVPSSLSVFQKAAKARIDKLVLDQINARKSGDFKKSDKIRKMSEDVGFKLINTTDGTYWSLLDA